MDSLRHQVDIAPVITTMEVVMKRHILFSTLFGLSIWSSFAMAQENGQLVHVQPLPSTQRYEVVTYDRRPMASQNTATQYWPTSRQAVVSSEPEAERARAEHKKINQQFMRFSNSM
jgi:hypothetical protein